MQNVTVKFTTPDYEMIFNDIYSIAASTEGGHFVIMPNHEKFIMSLCSGDVVLKDISSVTTIIVVANAVLSICDNKCNIIADIAFIFNKDKIKQLKEVQKLFEKNISNVIHDKFLYDILDQDLKFMSRYYNENIS
ncbi:hypothetical protein [Candidatus Neoehrlichia procyonis]|uniref:ATP synthase, Delta/Epsilon chain, beta-sandwich domain protein n=1 Tax=Candidatus Neoehrlichia procyonis str. RAC413 TaxID=1359163 RepID=A0A0F3NPE9_9RICK|nr:hypothetical protein [Candidatus Neoehrlichia lotoris]KJV68789.1 ATP synthase, Delta/Epsilon chain, beta-sandwich domain protein [Candidatus Neoehrlichia lotoris str. RAC413]